MFKSPGTKNGKQLGLNEHIHLFYFFLNFGHGIKGKKRDSLDTQKQFNYEKWGMTRFVYKE